MNNRIKAVRKSLKMTQQKFAEKIGLKQNSLALIESGKRNTSDQTILSICREYGVNEQWLRTGEGEMFVQTENPLEQIAAEHGLAPEWVEVIEYLMKLPESSRKAIITLVFDMAEALCKEENGENAVQRAARLLREEADAVEQGGGVSSVLSFTDDTESDCG